MKSVTWIIKMASLPGLLIAGIVHVVALCGHDVHHIYLPLFAVVFLSTAILIIFEQQLPSKVSSKAFKQDSPEFLIPSYPNNPDWMRYATIGLVAYAVGLILIAPHQAANARGIPIEQLESNPALLYWFSFVLAFFYWNVFMWSSSLLTRIPKKVPESGKA